MGNSSVGQVTTKAKYTTFTIDWLDLKSVVQSFLNGNPHHMRKANAEIFSRDIMRADTRFHGFTAGQLDRWLKEGFQTEAIQGLTEFTPLIRDKRKLRYSEEGDEFHVDLAMSGDENFMSEWTKKPIIPGVALDVASTFAGHVDAVTVNAYNVWICQAIYSLESAGVDCEITLTDEVTGLLRDGTTNLTRIRVKREGEASDFLGISPLVSPAGSRGLMFAANALHAEKMGTDVNPGLGTPVRTPWEVIYDPKTRRIAVHCDSKGLGFSAENMTRKLRDALKAAMKG